MESTLNSPAASHWIIVGSLDTFRRTADLGFTVQGIKSRHRKKAERMAPGDKIVYYVTDLRAFAGTATITSQYFESTDRIWTSGDLKKAAEDYLFRVRIAPDLVLPEPDFVPAEGIARHLHYVARYPAANWTLAFQGNVHSIGPDDYAVIRQALEARTVTGTTAGAETLRQTAD